MASPAVTPVTVSRDPQLIASTPPRGAILPRLAAIAAAPVHRKKIHMTNSHNTNGRTARLSTETKAAFKTTEFIAYVVILIGLFIASAVVDNGDDGQGFGADHVWLYATLLTIGYMVSRGLAKSGSREHADA